MRVFVILFAVSATLYSADALFLNQPEFNKRLNSVIKHVADVILLIPDKPGQKLERNQPGQTEPNQPGQTEPNHPGQKLELNQPGQNIELNQPGQNEAAQNQPKGQRVAQNLLMPAWTTLEEIQGRGNRRQSRSVDDQRAESVGYSSGELWEYLYKIYQDSKVGKGKVPQFKDITDHFLPKPDQRLRRSFAETDSIQTCIVQGIQAIVKCISKSAGSRGEMESLESDEGANIWYEECDSFEGISDDTGMKFWINKQYF